jgi:hypothetical protein
MKNKEQIASGPAPVKTILLVDDDASVRETLTRVLEAEGYLVRSAANGPDAIRIADSDSPDLVLLDLNLPDQSGWAIGERLSANNPLLSIIVITARPNQLFTALNAGVAALLEKPFDYPKLLETIATALEEPTEMRISRAAGRQADFRYFVPSTKAA